MTAAGCRWCGWRWRLGFAIPLIAICVVAALLNWAAGRKADLSDPSPSKDAAAPLIVALGDSFMSGEGAPRFLAGTDTKTNGCHRSQYAYPYLVAKQLSARLVFAACSGAVVKDLAGPAGQYPGSPPDVIGGSPQIDALKSSAKDVDFVLVSAGGNDAQFGDLVRTCLNEKCLSHADMWLRSIEALAEPLNAFYDDILATVSTSARVLIMTYPQPFVLPSCLGPMATDEMRFVLEDFLPQLNKTIEFAALSHGFEIVDTTDAFDGARLCEDGERTRDRAMNIVTFNRGDSRVGLNPSGSFHPTPLGHQLLVTRVLDVIAVPPAANSCTPPGSCPSTPPPNPPTLPPGGEAPFPPGTSCVGNVAISDTITTIENGQTSFEFEGEPNSTFCYRAYKQNWQSGQINNGGTGAIDTTALATGGTRLIEALIERSPNRWSHAVLFPESSVTAVEPSIWHRWVTRLVFVGAGSIMLALAPWVVCFICRGRRLRMLTNRLQECCPEAL